VEFALRALTSLPKQSQKAAADDGQRRGLRHRLGLSVDEVVCRDQINALANVLRAAAYRATRAEVEQIRCSQLQLDIGDRRIIEKNAQEGSSAAEARRDIIAAEGSAAIEQLHRRASPEFNVQEDRAESSGRRAGKRSGKREREFEFVVVAHRKRVAGAEGVELTGNAAVGGNKPVAADRVRIFQKKSADRESIGWDVYQLARNQDFGVGVGIGAIQLNRIPVDFAAAACLSTGSVSVISTADGRTEIVEGRYRVSVTGARKDGLRKTRGRDSEQGGGSERAARTQIHSVSPFVSIRPKKSSATIEVCNCIEK